MVKKAQVKKKKGAVLNRCGKGGTQNPETEKKGAGTVTRPSTRQKQGQRKWKVTWCSVEVSRRKRRQEGKKKSEKGLETSKKKECSTRRADQKDSQNAMQRSDLCALLC